MEEKYEKLDLFKTLLQSFFSGTGKNSNINCQHIFALATNARNTNL
jgi:hypothetical protein